MPVKRQYRTQQISHTIQYWTQTSAPIQKDLNPRKKYPVPIHLYAKDSNALNSFIIWTQSMRLCKDRTALNIVGL